MNEKQITVPVNIRMGAPYDDPAFESLCREFDIFGTAQAALCAVFWRAADRALHVSHVAGDVINLLNHIQDVVSDDDWEKIDVMLWNKVTSASHSNSQAALAAKDLILDAKCTEIEALKMRLLSASEGSQRAKEAEVFYRDAERMLTMGEKELHGQIAALTAERDRWKDICLMYNTKYSETLAERDAARASEAVYRQLCEDAKPFAQSNVALRADLDALSKDAERLDYLQFNGSTVEVIPGIGESTPSWLFRVGGLYKSSRASIRDAIDAAMTKEPK